MAISSTDVDVSVVMTVRVSMVVTSMIMALFSMVVIVAAKMVMNLSLM